MNDETRKLFSAPWQIWGDGCQVCDIRGTERAYCDDLADSARLARLPELYDALWESIFLINRLIGAWEDGMDFCDFCDEYLKKYNNVPSGFTCEWAQLLMKVRNGE